jgi:hypothetical protein
VPVVACLAFRADDGLVVALGSPTAVLGVLTLAWGLVALVVRAGGD